MPLKRSFTIFRIQIYSTRSVSVQSLNTDRVDLNSLIFFKWLLVVPFLIYRIRIIGYNLFDIKYRLGFESQKRDKTIIRILFKNLFRLAVRMCVSTCSHRYLTSDFGVFKLFQFVLHLQYSWYTGKPLSLYHNLDPKVNLQTQMAMVFTFETTQMWLYGRRYIDLYKSVQT